MYSEPKLKEIQDFAKEIRIQTLDQMASRGFGHLGGAMSIADIVAVLYGAEMKCDPLDPKWDERDWLICSKGHAGPTLYSALALKGYFPMDWLQTLNQPLSNLPSHCDRTKTPGIDITTGSLGQGLSLGVGLAIGHTIKKLDNRIYVIIGDGEAQEGQIWEAAMLAGQKKLDNLILFVDNNKVQLDNETDAINSLEDFEERFKAFKWHTIRIDGHDVQAVGEAVSKAKANKGKPTAIICDTVKGKGVVWAEGEFNHHIEVSRELADQAIDVLNAKGRS